MDPATLGPIDQKDPERIHLVFQLKRLLRDAPFIPEGEKQQMEEVIAYFGSDILRALVAGMVRESLRVLGDKRNASSASL